MPKLPAAAHRKLAAAMASGRIPDDGQPGYDDFFDVYSELGYSLDQAWADTDAGPARRHVSALAELWSAVQCDGLRTGVAANQPGLVAACAEAADAMRLPGVRALLVRVQACIPPAVHALDDCGDRFEWYESAQGRPLAEQLESLEEEINEGDFGEVMMEAAARLMLAEPGEFFHAD